MAELMSDRRLASQESLERSLFELRIVVGFMVLIAYGVIWGRFAVAFFDFHYDDSYIMYRYIENLVAGHGLAFNVGERLEGFSSLAWVLIVGAVRAISTADTILLSKAVGAVFEGLAFFAVFLVIWRFSARFNLGESMRIGLAAVIALLPLSIGSTTIWAMSGLENSLYAFALVLYVVCVAERFAVPSGLALMLVATTRVEGVMFCVLPLALDLLELLFCRAFWRQPGAALRRRFLAEQKAFYVRFIAIVVAYIVVITGFRLIYFGDYLPATAHFKRPAGIGDNIEAGWRYLSAFSTSYPAFSVLFVVALAAVPFWARNRFSSGALVVVLIQVMFALWVGGDWMGYHRFFASFTPLAALSVAGPMVAIASRGVFHKTGVFIALVISAPNLYSNVLPLYREAARGQGMAVSINAVNAPIGRFLRASTPSDGIIAVGDSGAIPYYAQRNIIDLHGLLDKHLISYVGNFATDAHSDVDVDYVLSRKPTWFVIVANGPKGTPAGSQGAYPLYTKILVDPGFKDRYAFHSEYMLTPWYVYQLFYDRRQFVAMSVSVTIETQTEGKDTAEFYFTGPENVITAGFEGGVRQNLEASDFHWTASQIASEFRFDPGNVGGHRVVLSNYKVTCAGREYSGFPPVSRLRWSNVKFLAATADILVFETTTNDPVLFFPGCPTNPT